MPKSLLSTCLVLSVLSACSQGNYPEAGSCSTDQPWYALCTHNDHGLNGWTSECFADKSRAQQLADEHANQVHQGIMRWTGVGHVDKAQLLMR